MTIVWERSYGMEIANRPSIDWHDECRLDDDGASRSRSVIIGGGCVQAIVFATGVIELQSSDRISNSDFTLALEDWKQQLTATPFNGIEVKAGNAALISAGM